MSITAKADAITNELPVSTLYGYLILQNYTKASISFATGDVNLTNNTIDLSGSFLPAAVVGMRVVFTGLSATTDLNNSQVYWIESLSGTDATFTDRPGGSAIDLTVAVSGTIEDVAPVEVVNGILSKTENVAEAVRSEVASYGTMGTTGIRPSITAPSALTYYTAATRPTDASGNAVEAMGVGYADFGCDLTTSIPVTYNYATPIKGGTSARGNTTGAMSPFLDSTGDGTALIATGAGTHPLSLSFEYLS
jgi:hypothetical protein